MNRCVLPMACILSVVGLLVSGACGIFSYPSNGGKSLEANATAMNLKFTFVDDTGTPLDGVSVKVTRYALNASIGWGGTYLETKPDEKYTADKTFGYPSLGNAAVRVECSKKGYDTFADTYAKASAVADTGTGFGGGPTVLTCTDVTEKSEFTVVLKRQNVQPR